MEEPQFSIPPPETPDYTRPLNQLSFKEAISEQGQMGGAWSPKWREKYDWGMRFVLRPALFVIVVWLNIWWDRHVCAMVWQSGREKTGFHLPDSVLVALVTTSMGNFIALVIIIAKHLFPEMKPGTNPN